jgi:hypothetical protein
VTRKYEGGRTTDEGHQYYRAKKRKLLERRKCVFFLKNTFGVNLQVFLVLTPFRSAKYSRRTGGGALCTGADGPRAGPDGPRPGARRGGTLCAGADCSRPGAGRSAAWCAARASLPDGRTVRALGPDGPCPGAGRSARAQGRRKIAGGAWISLPRGTPSGRRDPRSCLGSGRPT